MALDNSKTELVWIIIQHTLNSLHFNAMFNDIMTTDEMFLEVVFDGCTMLTVGALEGFLTSVCSKVPGQVRS